MYPLFSISDDDCFIESGKCRMRRSPEELEPFGLLQKFFTGQMPFLMPNQQCHNDKGSVY